ncbi:MAG: hypothetical protein IJW25_01850 [Clostridia bacterium]|nr:hypothetical protein [Clostridia bacterium]
MSKILTSSKTIFSLVFSFILLASIMIFAGCNKPEAKDVNVVAVVGQEYVIDTLPAIRADVEGNIKGIIEWDENQTIKPGVNKYNWTFTPKDTALYKITTGSVSLKTVDSIAGGQTFTTNPNTKWVADDNVSQTDAPKIYVYENCVFNEPISSSVKADFIFIDCTFKAGANGEPCVYLTAPANITFDGCTFTGVLGMAGETNGYALDLNIYSATTNSIVIKNSVFSATTPAGVKDVAISIKTRLGSTDKPSDAWAAGQTAGSISGKVVIENNNFVGNDNNIYIGCEPQGVSYANLTTGAFDVEIKNNKDLVNVYEKYYYAQNETVSIQRITANQVATFGNKTKEITQYTATFKVGGAMYDEVDYYVTDGTLQTEPAVPVKNGFAGVWEDYTLEANDITVNAVYGDGSQANPYMVETAEQWITMLNACPDEQSYKYFKLIADIDLSSLADNLGVDTFAGSIDGNGYKIINPKASTFANNAGMMINTSINLVIKNLTVALSDRITSFVYIARGESIEFENVVIENMPGVDYTVFTADDTNESPFVCHVFAASASFKDCINNANYIMEGYAGIFIGGYARTSDYDLTLTFDHCVNNGDVYALKEFGMLIGNSSCNETNKPKVITVKNGTVNNGTIRYNQNHFSSLLYGFNSGLNELDFNTANNTNINGNGSMQPIESLGYSVDTSGNIVINKGSASTVTAAKFKVYLSAYAAGKSEEDADNSTLLLNIVKEATLSADAESFDTGIKLGVFKDKTNFTGTIAQNQVWTNIEGYAGIKYFYD